MSSRIPPILRPEHPTPRPLAWLVQEFGLEARGDLDGVEVTGVTLSTNDLHPGDLFVGVPGMVTVVRWYLRRATPAYVREAAAYASLNGTGEEDDEEEDDEEEEEDEEDDEKE